MKEVEGLGEGGETGASLLTGVLLRPMGKDDRGLKLLGLLITFLSRLQETRLETKSSKVMKESRSALNQSLLFDHSAIS